MAARAAAAEAWQEFLQQNWRVELDAGLGGAVPESEALLLVCAPAAVRQLLEAAGTPLSSAEGPAPGSLCVLHAAGTQAGDPLDWQGLGKRLVLAAVSPAGGTIASALEAAANAPAQ